MEVEGIQDLEQGVFFRTTVELEYSSNWSPDSSWTLGELLLFFLNMIVSNATIYPRESKKNNRKNQHTDDSHQEEVQSYESAQLQTHRHL